jgi:hypothetical protein
MDARTVAGALLLVGPLVAAVVVGHPSLYPVWSADRERRLAIVAAHRRAWRFLNAGFIVAAVSTSAGLAVLAGTAADAGQGAVLASVAVAYAIAGALWCAVLAARARTWPLLADHVAGGRATLPTEAFVDAILGGLFDAFALLTGAVLVVLGLALAAGGGVALPVALLAAVIGGAALIGHLVTGDTIPAVLYLPTLLVGLALLLGWT